MAKNKISDGNRWNWTATAAKSSGDVIQASGLVGIALADAVTGDVIALDLYGEYRLTKPTGMAVAAGAGVYVTSAGALSATSTSNTANAILTACSLSAMAPAESGAICVSKNCLIISSMID